MENLKKGEVASPRQTVALAIAVAAKLHVHIPGLVLDKGCRSCIAAWEASPSVMDMLKMAWELGENAGYERGYNDGVDIPDDSYVAPPNPFEETP